MMSHNSSAIITILEMPGKRLTTEYDHTRSGDSSTATVRLPFGTEYAIGWKFRHPTLRNALDNTTRRRIEVTIDGAVAVDSLIIQGQGHLERFLESDKRFKFVEADNEAVADPSNPSNGNIVVRVWKEVQRTYCPPIILPPIIIDQNKWPMQPLQPAPWDPWTRPVYGSPTCDSNITLSSSGTQTGGTVGSGRGMSAGPNIQCSASNVAMPCGGETTVYTSSAQAGGILRSQGFSDVGATVEGSKSNQKFGSTTWNGDDGEPLVFSFNLKGKVHRSASNDECQSCGSSLKASDKWCSSCGTKVKRATATV